MKTPLCFSHDNCAPGVFKGMVSYEYVRNLAERLHPQGRLVMGNSTPIR
jgi:2-succinyl-5-enolpyruvyl-6-hydroxy-3-cyclohexene-1-carboxylate synthase